MVLLMLAQTIKPQPKQELFLSSPADICIFGGAAGGGKSFACLLEPLRHIHVRRFGAVIFRRTYPEIIKEGGLWDEAMALYSRVGGVPNKNDLLFHFKGGSRISFVSMQYENDKYAWKSSQIPLIIFDQLESFTEGQFFYMFSRNRSICGVKPYIRATCNPDESSWLAGFLGWWIAADGYADLTHAGKLLWMVRRADDRIAWFWSREEAFDAYPDDPDLDPKSVTFIPSTVYDNQELLKRDPGYIGNLKALPLVDRERLLGDAKRGGNWLIKPSAGKVFNRAWFKIVDAVPAGGTVVRRWDFAATEKELSKKDPDYTASCLMLKVNDQYFILDVTAEQVAPAEIDRRLINISRQDQARFEQELPSHTEPKILRRYRVRWEEEGGSSGKRESFRMVQELAGLDCRGVTSHKDKLIRAKPLAAQVEAGNVFLLAGAWNEMFLNHMHGQPDLSHDDMMDAAAGAFFDLTAPEEQAVEYVSNIWDGQNYGRKYDF